MAEVMICCVCTGNTCRSPMLAALLARALADTRPAISICSAGIAALPGCPASPHAITVMTDRGLDIRHHRSRPIESLPLDRIALFCCLGPHHAEALIAGGIPEQRITVVNAAGGGIADPYGGALRDYAACADQLEACLEKLVTVCQAVRP